MPSFPREFLFSPETHRPEPDPDSVFCSGHIPFESALASLVGSGYMTFRSTFLPAEGAFIPSQNSGCYGRRLEPVRCDLSALSLFLDRLLVEYLDVVMKTGLVVPLVFGDHVVYLMPVNMHAIEYLEKEVHQNLLLDVSSLDAAGVFQERVTYPYSSARGILHDGFLKAILLKPDSNRLIEEGANQGERLDFDVLYAALWER